MVVASVCKVNAQPYCRHSTTTWLERVLASRLRGERHRDGGDDRLQPDAGALPLALLVLFVVGQVLKIGGVEASVLNDLEELFPKPSRRRWPTRSAEIQGNSTTIGIVAFVGGLWIGAWFWGAMDTAFRRIYHVECRGWLEQKGFSFAMLGRRPAVPRRLHRPADDRERPSSPASTGCRSGSPGPRRSAPWLLLGAAVPVTFVICCVIFWVVPKGHMPWRAVWPGAAVRDPRGRRRELVFPFYLSNVSGLSRFGSIVGFILVALIWFYVLCLGLFAGAVINALRYEVHDTGELPYGNSLHTGGMQGL